MEKLPENIQKIISEKDEMNGKENIAEKYTEFLSDNFLYSKYRHNTTNLYKKHPSYIT
jgi:hypothetical protein